MHDDTKKELNEIIELLEDNGYTVTAGDFREYSFGASAPREGYDEIDRLSVEFDVTVSKQIIDDEDDDQNDFRIN
jgi:hypothetical protein